MPTVIDTGKIGPDGQSIHPLLGNTVKDGTGTWYVVVLNSDGKVIAAQS
jgi:hypothetical protein